MTLPPPHGYGLVDLKAWDGMAALGVEMRRDGSVARCEKRI